MPRLKTCQQIGFLALLNMGMGVISYGQVVPIPAVTTPERNIPSMKSGDTYKLGIDDLLTIHAVNVPEISDKPVRVDLQGEINLSIVGRIHAEGMTAAQLEDEIKKRLKEFLEAPDVVVNVSDFRKERETNEPVSVIGSVGTPGVYQLKGGKTLVEVLSLAGGLRTEAGPVVRITRKLERGRIPLATATDDSTGKFSLVQIELKSLLAGADPERNLQIRTDDVIAVARAEIVYVMGEVGKTGPIQLSDGHSISVLQAVSEAGGILRTAAANHAKILRPIMGGPKRAELPLDLKKIMKGQANDPPLIAGDILLVPGSSSKQARTRALEAAIQAGTMIGTYSAIH